MKRTETLAFATASASSSHRRGLVILELVLGIVAGFALMIGILLPALAKSRQSARQIKCSTQVRNIVQGCQIWANSNRDQYPTPSIVDANNQTIAGNANDKDHTGNVLSLLVFTTMIAPEHAVSPSEVSSKIRVLNNYQDTKPKAAANPAKALWDPAFSADWTRPERGNVSYASMEISATRKAIWGNTFSATESPFGNRAPAINSFKRGPKGNALVEFDKQSLTLQIHGGRNTWEGNIAYNDGHVNFETRFDPLETTILLPGPGNKAVTDLLFADDPEDPKHVNNFLGVSIKGSATPGGSKMIND